MSFPRVSASLASAVPAVFKAASPAALPLARRCPQCLRAFSSYRPIHQSSKRQLQTATAYHPQSLDPPPPPPRNAGVPDTSIAGGKPQLSDSRPPRLTEQYGSSSAAVQEERHSVSVTEAEAQKSKPASATTATSASTAAAPSQRPRRSKLRPRKAAMTLSGAAVEQLRGLLDQPEPKLIRVGVKNRGCSGLAYHLEYVDKPGAFDEAVEQDGVKVLIDSKALFSIIGSEMDWQEDKLSARFVFKNPNITEQCGCGESFSIS